MKNFAVFGVGGYVAPRHLKAIKETGNQMVAAYDKSDSVGIIDSYFPEAAFFTEMELFDRHVSKLKHTDNQLDIISICTPNYLHDAHTRYALRLGTDVICEKPLVLNPWNIDNLVEMEKETGHKSCLFLFRPKGRRTAGRSVKKTVLRTVFSDGSCGSSSVRFSGGKTRRVPSGAVIKDSNL